MNNKGKADFCIEIDFEKGAESPSRVFRAMTELIETFQAIDKALVESIDVKIEPVVVIEDIESGSIKTWLSYALRAVDDDALKNMDWKKQVGKYLVKAKYFVLNFIEDKTEITSLEQIKDLEIKLLKSAEETDVIHFPSYAPVQRQKLLPSLTRLNKALQNLNENEKAIYISVDNSVSMNAAFNIVPEKLEELLTNETISSKAEMILKVKKPDYLSDSMWQFRHGTRIIDAKIVDITWLKLFQNREKDVRPGDSLRVIMETIIKYGFDNELVGMHYNIIEVKEIIPMQKQEQYPLLPDGAKH
jgi:regulator of replication initiation timing